VVNSYHMTWFLCIALVVFSLLAVADEAANIQEQFIALEQEYGRDKIEQAAAIIRTKDIDNPQRCVGYFIGIIKNLK
jgi:hypothetical protein